EAAIAVSDAQFFEQSAETGVENRKALTARGLAQRTSEPGLAEAGSAGDEDVVSGANPVGAGETRELARIETAGAARVEILDAGFGILELGLFEQTFQASGVAPGEFAIDQQAEPIFEGEAGGHRLGELFL